jgi:hypothetical protein
MVQSAATATAPGRTAKRVLKSRPEADEIAVFTRVAGGTTITELALGMQGQSPEISIFDFIGGSNEICPRTEARA